MLDHWFITILIIIFTIYAIFSRRLLFSAVALGISSMLLAVLFFNLQAPFAGGFELSVGAGLISLLFIMAISLTERKQL
ncbi:MAG TPA: NADH-quinone oxidoreductase subunit J [Pelolinea sp.]|nr:NADH-quinone oxidoreductase subunit J [Pelolinea sp.]